jgi:hypothetical protein
VRREEEKMRVSRCIPVVIMSVVACGGGRDADRGGVVDRSAHARDDASAADRLQAAVVSALDHEMAAHPEVRNAVVQVHLLSQDLHATRAAGNADPATHKRMTPGTPFRIASVAKTMRAAVIMQLVEEGRLSLSDTAGFSGRSPGMFPRLTLWWSARSTHSP